MIKSRRIKGRRNNCNWCKVQIGFGVPESRATKEYFVCTWEMQAGVCELFLRGQSSRRQQFDEYDKAVNHSLCSSHSSKLHSLENLWEITNVLDSYLLPSPKHTVDSMPRRTDAIGRHSVAIIRHFMFIFPLMSQWMSGTWYSLTFTLFFFFFADAFSFCFLAYVTHCFGPFFWALALDRKNDRIIPTLKQR